MTPTHRALAALATAAVNDPDAALAELLGELEGAEDGAYREAVAGLIGVELVA